MEYVQVMEQLLTVRANFSEDSLFGTFTGGKGSLVYFKEQGVNCV